MSVDAGPPATLGTRLGRAGLVLLALLLATAALAPWLAPFDPDALAGAPFSPPDSTHLLGTNDVGQDILSQVLVGARVSLGVGLLAAVCATLAGATIGLSAALAGGAADAALMRVVDVMLALPVLPLLIVLSAYLGPGWTTQVLVIAGVMWARTARVLRSRALSVRERAHVRAAEAMGASGWHLLRVQVLPVVFPLLIPELVRAANTAVLMEASLSFLGLGDPTSRSWGGILLYANARTAFLTGAWVWWIVPPGVGISLTILAFGFVGYALEERAHPRYGARPEPAPRPSRPAARRDRPPAAIDLTVEDLVVEYAGARGGVRAVDGVSFELRPGEIVGLTGESGCGKTTLVTALLGLLKAPARVVSGRISMAGTDVTTAAPEELRRLRGATIALMPQSAMNALDPVVRVIDQVVEAIAVHAPRDGRGQAEARQRAAECLEAVGLPIGRHRAYPHQLSGGMRQRAVLAMAMVNRPALLVADEPTSGLDTVLQVALLRLLRDLARQRGTAVLIVSHDLGAVQSVADRVLVMHRGRIVDRCTAAALTSDSRAEHTRRLVASLPRLEAPGRPADASRPPADSLLDVESVTRVFRPRGSAPVVAVRDITFRLAPGESLGVVGSSGAGKSTMAGLIAGLVRPSGGRIVLGGHEWSARAPLRPRRVRRLCQLVFQDPYEALSPTLPVADAVAEPLRIHRLGSAREQDAAVRVALEECLLTPVDRYLARRPHELSGGERQRVALARALVLQPAIIVADEPTSLLDASRRLELQTLMQRLGDRHGTAYVYITHDLALATSFCERLVIMSEGAVVEQGDTADIVARPRHPATIALLDAARALQIGS